MRVELYKFKRCCFCLPLRYGILVTGYFKLIVLMLMLIFITVECVGWFISRGADVSRITFFTVITTVLLFDIAFTLVFIIGCHKKNPRLLRIYNYYAIGVLVLSVLSLITLIVIGMFKLLPYAGVLFAAMILKVHFFTGLCNICIQVYMILLTRSEIYKLENNCKFRFTNVANEAECNMDEGVNEMNRSYVRNVESVDENEANDEIEERDETEKKMNGNYGRLVN